MTKYVLSVLSLSIVATLSSLADARHFTYVYETTLEEAGEVELENWVTWQTRKPGEHGFQELDLRHEIEFGVTNDLQVGVYLADWSYVDSRERCGLVFSDAALEAIYSIYDPEKNPVGLAVYEEIDGGDRLFGSESKLIVQKKLGRVVLAYNATLEATWQGEELAEREAEFQQSFGASYKIDHGLSIGAECVHEMAFPEGSHREDSVVSGGPNVSVKIGKCWTTITALTQVTRAADEPVVQVRAIAGYAF